MTSRRVINNGRFVKLVPYFMIQLNYSFIPANYPPIEYEPNLRIIVEWFQCLRDSQRSQRRTHINITNFQVARPWYSLGERLALHRCAKLCQRVSGERCSTSLILWTKCTWRSYLISSCACLASRIISALFVLATVTYSLSQSVIRFLQGVFALWVPHCYISSLSPTGVFLCVGLCRAPIINYTI